MVDMKGGSGDRVKEGIGIGWVFLFINVVMFGG